MRSQALGFSNRMSVRKTRPRTTTGLDQPGPTGARQRTFNPSAGNVLRMPVSFQTPSRFGPRNCGQSAARTAKGSNKASVAAIRVIVELAKDDDLPCRVHCSDVLANGK